MKKWLLMLLMSPSLAFANIGDTIEQSAERYGKPTWSDAKHGVVVWVGEGISVKAYFDETGVCDSMVYYKEPVNNLTVCFRTDEIDTLIAMNMIGKFYRYEPNGYGMKWVTTDGTMLAYASVVSGGSVNQWALKIATMEGDERSNTVNKTMLNESAKEQKQKPQPNSSNAKKQRV